MNDCEPSSNDPIGAERPLLKHTAIESKSLTIRDTGTLRYVDALNI